MVEYDHCKLSRGEPNQHYSMPTGYVPDLGRETVSAGPVPQLGREICSLGRSIVLAGPRRNNRAPK